MAEQLKVTAVTGEVRYFNDEFDARVWAGLNGRIEVVAQAHPMECAASPSVSESSPPVASQKEQS